MANHINIDKIKEAASQAIDDNASALNALSQEIWLHPELAYAEKHAHKVLTDYLIQNDFIVEQHYHLETAFKATYGKENKRGLNVAVICEYDALPEIGHACGHNLIAEVGIATALGIKAAFNAIGEPLGQLTVLGTPAEEDDGGKLQLIEAGTFKDIDFALMAHPTPANESHTTTLALDMCTVTYRGLAAHASGFPWEGINALDAAVLCYQNISCLRQHLRPTWRVHGVINKGGVKPNIIPDLTELEYYIRAPTDSELQTLKDKVVPCFHSAATATGCQVDVSFSPSHYSNLVSNATLANLYRREAEALTITFPDEKSLAIGSTDMGNVSHEVPSIHPNFYIGTDAANHTKDFTAASGSLIAQPYTLTTAKALAHTALEVLKTPELLEHIQKDFEKDKMRF